MQVFIGPYPGKGDEERRIEIEVHDYDTWNLDHTLGLVIIAALKKYIETPHGAPYIPNEDVPPHLHRPDGIEEWSTDDSWHPRWEWVLNEMLFAFEHGNKDTDFDEPKEVIERAENGRRLFAKYFHAMWN